MLQYLHRFGFGRESSSASLVQTATPDGADGQKFVGEASGEDEAIAQGKLRFEQGKLAEALTISDEALASWPGNVALHFARGATLYAWGRFHEAREAFGRAHAAGMAHLDLDIARGWVAINLNRLDDAEVHFRAALDRDPGAESTYVALANTLEMRGALAASAAEFAVGLARWPRNYEGLILLAACRFHLGDYDGGVRATRAAIELDPSRSRAWANLGVVLGGKAQFDEALAMLQRAHAIDAANGSAESVVNYATILREASRIEDSLRVIEESLPAHPDPRAHWLRSVLLLELGRYQEAWPQHEFRWMREPLVDHRKPLSGPVWGGQDLVGKTILLQAEQGLGDVVQFVRFARPLKERGARVVFESFRDLGDIAHDFLDIDEVAPDTGPPPCDFRIPLLGVPRVIGTTLDTVPGHVPYVKVQPGHIERWAQRIPPDGRLRVGIVWSGNQKHPRNHFRSMPLERLAPLWQVEGVKWYSLQKSATAEGEIAASGLEIVDLGKDFESFRDTAAAISLLDLVITVDTSVAHLAGALGRPMWVMVGEPPDWRWLVEGDTTPWYPSARIFRQATHNQWGPVIDAVRAALQKRVGSHAKGDSLPPESVSPPVSVRTHTTRNPANGQPPELCGVDETRNGIVQSLPSTELGASLSYYGEFRQAELDLVGRFIKPGGWIIEQNCGVGATTLYLARTVGDAGHVIAFEPDRIHCQIARQNLTANRIRNVTLLMRELGSPSSFGPDVGGVGESRVPIDDIDGLRVSRLDWIRINRGAAAEAVLAGASATLWRLRPWIFIVTEGGADEEGAIRLLRDHAYQLRRFRAPLFNPANYNRRGDDIFAGREAFGLLCVPEEIEIDTELEGCTPVR